ncbi:RHS repeat-associated core domain-containing protein [Streptomyces sp. NPDC002328]|uniref:RHS repeat-associated core domain-containing protein n=1 Tax=Streptomyces sp. NPDC002328 TaxID=3364642 RepID=UPI00367681EE
MWSAWRFWSPQQRASDLRVFLARRQGLPGQTCRRRHRTHAYRHPRVDPTTGRFLSVDPVLAPADHESLNGYAYANNTSITKSDPTGLRPVTDWERGCNDGNGGRYHDYMTPGPNGTWVCHSTRTYTFKVPVAGTMAVTVRTRGRSVTSPRGLEPCAGADVISRCPDHRSLPGAGWRGHRPIPPPKREAR